ARLESHLGAFRAELARSRAAALMAEGDALAALASIAALLTTYLPQREPHGALYAATMQLIDMLGVAPDWPEAYVGWEALLLAELGFALDLSRCAVSGEEDDLAYVSPRTGRAVGAAAAAPFSGRLLVLPAFLGGAPSNEAGRGVPAGMRLTGHFIAGWIAPAFGGAVPAARARLQERLERRGA
ncbi:MAG: DNA repair protein RecO C-terminal domain-containing protein, partial [Paracoccaceae bacterium]